MQETALKPGFPEPVKNAQNMFRYLLDVMSRPGKIQTIKPDAEAVGSCNATTITTALTLLDYETPFWLSESLNTEEIAYYLTFHTGAKRTEKTDQASFLLVGNISELPPLNEISLGNPEYPDSSATILLLVPSFSNGMKVELSGPGIKEQISFSAEGLDENFWKMAQANNALYPQGIDFFFCSESAIAALPRSTTIKV